MMILQGNIPPLDLLFGPSRPSCQNGGSVLLVSGYIPLALSTSEGAGSVWILVHLPGAHLFTQVLGNKTPYGCNGPATLFYACAAAKLDCEKSIGVFRQ